MQQIYSARSKLEAERLRVFLVEHALRADIQEAIHAPDPCGETDLATYAIWVTDDEAVAARGLIGQFQSLNDSTEESKTVDGEQGVGDQTSLTSFLKSFPWLTLAFCIACAIVSFGLWREPDPNSDVAQARWGWRDGLDISDGAYWAVITSAMLHPTASHLVWNLAGILCLGTGIERGYGRMCLAGLLLSGALIGKSAELAERGLQGCGASGILYALLGFTLAALVRRRLLPGWLLLVLSVWLLYGAAFDAAAYLVHRFTEEPLGDTAVEAHLASLLFGILVAIACVICWRPWLTRTVLVIILLAALLPLRGSPWLPNWLISRADRDFRKGDVAAALDAYSRAIAGSRHPATAYVQRGFVLQSEARFEEALSDFAAAIANDPKVFYARAARALVLEFNSDLDGAWREANEEVGEAGGSSFAYQIRASIAFSRNDRDAAWHDFERALQLESDSAITWSMRSERRLDQCRFDSAQADVNHALWLDPRDGTALLVSGTIHSQIAQFDKARTEIHRAFEQLQPEQKKRPRDISLHCSLASGNLTLFECDPVPELLQETERLLDAALPLAPQYWIVHELRGDLELKRKDFSLAEKNLSRALELNPDSAWALCLRGLARHEIGRHEDAFRDVDRALVLNPRFSYAFRSRAVLRRSRGDHAGAIFDLSQSLELNARFAEAYLLRGQSRLAIGEENAARKDFAAAVELDPRLEAQAYLNR